MFTILSLALAYLVAAQPENCLVAADGHLALTDFGTAVMEGPNYMKSLSETAGTLSYMAPECLACEPHGQAVDMWSFGVCSVIYWHSLR